MILVKPPKIKLVGLKPSLVTRRGRASETLAKINWQEKQNGVALKMIQPFQVKNPLLGTMTVSIREVNHELDTFLIELKNSLKRVFGEESFVVQQNENTIAGMNIETAQEYRATSRGRRHGFGELIRLTSVMQMLENHYDAISIFAKNTAVFFHGKYKFRPNISQKKEALDILTTLINDKSAKFHDLSVKAQSLFNEFENFDSLTKEEKLILFKKVNSVVGRYIKRALAEGKHGQGHEFDKGMHMILTRDVVEKEKKFFNTRYKRQGIDYTI